MSTPSTAQPDANELELEAAQAAPASLHAPFLERSADPDSEDSAHALGAFLTLRVIDQFSNLKADSQAFAHQVRATLQYLNDLQPTTQEVEHLIGIARAAGTAWRLKAPQGIWTPLSNYTAWLEGQVRLPEAQDVLETALRAADRHNDVVAQIAIHLQRGRVLRNASRADEANKAYAAAGALAKTHGDSHTEMRSRLGRGIVLRQIGNLSGAAKAFEELLDDAASANDDRVRAWALHDLAATRILQGRYEDAATLAYDAFNRYEDAENKRRVLHDLGMALKHLGHFRAARDAFDLVLSSDPTERHRVSVLVEQLHLATAIGDRVSFERRRRQLESTLDKLTPFVLVDYHLGLGEGFGVFGNREKAREHFLEAARLSELYDLNEYLFRAEAAIETLDRPLKQKPVAPLPASWEDSSEVQLVADGLHALLVGS